MSDSSDYEVDYEEDDRLLREGGPELDPVTAPTHELISELMLRQRLLITQQSQQQIQQPAEGLELSVTDEKEQTSRAPPTEVSDSSQLKGMLSTTMPSDSNHRLPTRAQMHTYDPTIQSYIVDSAISTLGTYLVPRIQLRNWRKLKREHVDNHDERTISVTPDRLAQISIFKGWPREASEEVCKRMVLRVYESGEILTHPREPSREMLFLGFGAVKQATYLGGKLTAVTAKRLSFAAGAHMIGALMPGAATSGTTTTVPPQQSSTTERRTLPPARDPLNGNHASSKSPIKGPSSSHFHAGVSQADILSNAALGSTVHYAPMCFGELSLLTDEPWPYFLQAHGGRCFAWALSKGDFTEVLQRVASHYIATTIRAAFQRRNDTMRATFPMTIATLREHAIFQNVSEPCAQATLERLDPSAVPANYLLCKEKDSCNRMLFLRSGVLGIYKAKSSLAVPTTATSSPTKRSGSTINKKGFSSTSDDNVESPHNQSVTHTGGSLHDEVLVRAVKAPYILCDADLVHGSSNDATIRSITHCDIYQLTQSSFAAVVHAFPRDVDRMLEAARARKQQEVNNNAAYYKAIIQQMPILRDVLSQDQISVLLRLFAPRSYRPMVPVCSVSEYCDRIILLTRGILRVGNGTASPQVGGGGSSGMNSSTLGDLMLGGSRSADVPTCLKPGDSIGWTCCIPHRWAKGVVSGATTVEVLELPQIDLMNFLHREGLLTRVVALTEGLLFPRAGRDGVKIPISVRPTVDSTGLPPSLRVYPVSRSRVVNYNEPGFCSVHMNVLSMQEQLERERKRRLGIQPKEPYKQLGSGIWVPLSKNVKGFDSTLPEKPPK